MENRKKSNDINQGLYPNYPNGALDNTLNVRIDSLVKLMDEKEKRIYDHFESIERSISTNQEAFEKFIKNIEDEKSKKAERKYSLKTLIIMNGVTILIAFVGWTLVIVGWFLKK